MCFTTDAIKINTLELDADQLCNRYGDWSNIDRVMRDWQETNSPTAFWSKQMSVSGNYAKRYRETCFPWIYLYLKSTWGAESVIRVHL